MEMGPLDGTPQSYTTAAKAAEDDDFACILLLQVSSCEFETFYRLSTSIHPFLFLCIRHPSFLVAREVTDPASELS